MRMTAFSPISLSHTMPSAKPTPSVAEQAKPLVLQTASGDTFTAVSAQKAENRSGLNTNWDVKGVEAVAAWLENLGKDYYIFATAKKQIGLDVLEFASQVGGAVEFRLTRSHDRNKLKLEDLREKDLKTLISFEMQVLINQLVKVQTIAGEKGAVIQRREGTPNKNNFHSEPWRHPYMKEGLDDIKAKIILRSLSKDKQFEAATLDDINPLFEKCQALADKLFEDKKTLLH
jgi:hypothetical protein